MAHHQPKQPTDYTVAIICALQVELQAVTVMLDRNYDLHLPLSPGDTNIYTYGELCGHQVVACCLPGLYGKGSAATVATNLGRTFTSIRWRLMVGIGGGIPSERHHVCLGDVVVSMPSGTHGGVVQYDLGKQTADQFILTGFLRPPPAHLQNAAIHMQNGHRIENCNKIADHIGNVLARYPHLSEHARPESDAEPDPGPRIHYGLIASGDTLFKNKQSRDKLRETLGDVLCVEMEAAGISTAYECIVIRGICDLADENKNDAWQGYAAAAAAACAKELLKRVPKKEAATRQSESSTSATENSQRSGQKALEYRQDEPHRDYYHAFQRGGGTQQLGSGNTSINGSGNSVYR